MIPKALAKARIQIRPCAFAAVDEDIVPRTAKSQFIAWTTKTKMSRDIVKMDSFLQLWSASLEVHTARPTDALGSASE